MGGLKIVILHVIGPFVVSAQVAEDAFDGVEDAIFEVIPDLGWNLLNLLLTQSIDVTFKVWNHWPRLLAAEAAVFCWGIIRQVSIYAYSVRFHKNVVDRPVYEV